MSEYGKALPAVVEAARSAGESLLRQYNPDMRPVDRTAMYEIGVPLEAEALDTLRRGLDGVCPGAGWFDDDEDGMAVPPGEWWIADGVEGAVNFVHGLPEWGVAITLVRDGRPCLTVVREPVADLTYTAVAEGGAYRNGKRLRASAKTRLDAAVVTASQAGNDPAVHARFGRAFAAMSDRAMLVRNTIPTTFPLLNVAAGHSDVFWQYRPDLPGTAAGSLLAAEAGAVVTTLSGEPWRPDSPDVLVAAPGLHAAALATLVDAAVTA